MQQLSVDLSHDEIYDVGDVLNKVSLPVLVSLVFATRQLMRSLHAHCDALLTRESDTNADNLRALLVQNIASDEVYF